MSFSTLAPTAYHGHNRQPSTSSNASSSFSNYSNTSSLYSRASTVSSNSSVGSRYLSNFENEKPTTFSRPLPPPTSSFPTSVHDNAGKIEEMIVGRSSPRGSGGSARASPHTSPTK